MAKLMNNIQFDNAKEAMEYYESVFGAKIIGRNPIPEEIAKEMGLTCDISETTMIGYFSVLDNMILCSDNHESESKYSDQLSMVLDFNSDDAQEMANLEAIYASTTSDAKTEVIMPLAEQHWGGKMGIIKDAYGITWMFHAQSYKQMGM